MEIFIQTHFLEFKRGSKRSRSEMREIAQVVCDPINSDQLDGLIASMLERNQTVIDASGGQTKY